MPEDLDLTAASAGALADLEAAKPAEVAATEEPAAAAAAAEPAKAEPAAAAAATPAASAADVFELTVRGQTLKLNREQAIAYAQQGVDYTQKTQKVADEQRQILQAAALLQQREQEIATFLKDPARVQAYLAAQQSQARQTAASPDDIPTMGQLRDALEAKASAIQETLQRQVQQTEERIAQRVYEAEVSEKQDQYDRELSKTISSLAEKFPSLDVYNAKDLDIALRNDVFVQVKARIDAFPDQTIPIEDVRDMIVAAAKVRADHATLKFNDHIKMAKVREAKLSKQGIEPPGSVGEVPVKPQKQMKIGSKDLLDAAIADVMALQSK